MGLSTTGVGSHLRKSGPSGNMNFPKYQIGMHTASTEQMPLLMVRLLSNTMSRRPRCFPHRWYFPSSGYSPSRCCGFTLVSSITAVLLHSFVASIHHNSVDLLSSLDIRLGLTASHHASKRVDWNKPSLTASCRGGRGLRCILATHNFAWGLR